MTRWFYMIGSQSSVSPWLGPVLALCGSVLLFTGSMVVLWRTLKNTREEGRRGRAAQRNDRFREEVANLLGEKYLTVDAAEKLADDAKGGYDDVEGEVPPADRVGKVLTVREQQASQLNKVEHLAIRAALLTNDTEIIAVLGETRTAAQMWKDLVDKNPYETFMEIRDRLEAAFDQLETLTRKLVTSDGVG
jgi:hypothetical protein